MAKDKARATAKALFIKGKTQKDIAALVNVQEKTIGAWIKKYGWRQQLEAEVNGNKSRVENLKKVIGSITIERLALDTKINKAEGDGDTDKLKEYTKKSNQLANEIAMYSKSLEQLDQEKKIPLTVYIDIMDKIFADMQKKYPKIYIELVDFQADHINQIALKY